LQGVVMPKGDRNVLEVPTRDLHFTGRLSAIRSISAVVALLVSAACGSSEKAASKQETGPAEPKPAVETTPSYAVQELPGGVVEGRVSFKGKAPSPQKVVVNQDPGTCGTQREVYPVRIEQGGVVDAVVWIDNIQRGKPFAFREPVLQQKRCTYLPHVMLMQPGELKVESSDPIPHNVHTYAQNNREYNESMNQLRRSLTLSFQRPDQVSVRCDLHGWMQADVVVAKNPYYALTHEGGEFRLDGVPAGRYRLKAWSRALGETEQEIVVEAGKTTKVDFVLEPKPTQAAASK